MHIIDGSTHHHRHVPGNTPQVCKKFKQTCSRSVCGQLVVCVTAGDMNLSRGEVLETMQDASGFPDSVRVVGNTRDFLIGMLSAQQLAAALPTAHVGVGANGRGRCNATGLAATQDQPQEAASSSSDSSVQECERIRGWLKPVRGSWPSYSWKGFAKRSRNAEAAAEAAAAHAAEAA